MEKGMQFSRLPTSELLIHRKEMKVKYRMEIIK